MSAALLNFAFIKESWKNVSQLPQHQVSILEWFLKYHVTLKTEVMVAENSALHHMYKLHFEIH